MRVPSARCSSGVAVRRGAERREQRRRAGVRGPRAQRTAASGDCARARRDPALERGAQLAQPRARDPPATPAGAGAIRPALRRASAKSHGNTVEHRVARVAAPAAPVAHRSRDKSARTRRPGSAAGRSGRMRSFTSRSPPRTLARASAAPVAVPPIACAGARQRTSGDRAADDLVECDQAVLQRRRAETVTREPRRRTGLARRAAPCS